MSVARHHSHSEQHRGFVPEDQLADLTPTAGYVPIATGTGNAEWGPATGGAGCDCCFEPHTERFVAVGGTPETFLLPDSALYGVRVFVNGVRADPLDVLASPTEVFVDTITNDAVVIDYERDCGILGDGLLRFPGDLEAHEWFGDPQEMNILGHIISTGPAYLVIRGTITSGNPILVVGTDAHLGTGYSTEGIYDSTIGPPTFPTATDEYLFRLQHAETFWIAGTVFPYDPSLTGSLTMDIHYPDLGGTALASPGTDLALFGTDHVNLVATINTSVPRALFVTLDAPLPSGNALYVFSADFTKSFEVEPPINPIVAGTYVFILNQDDDEDGDWYVVISNGVGYQAGLSVSGEYETHLP
jgi:hypothetical protein